MAAGARQLAVLHRAHVWQRRTGRVAQGGQRQVVGPGHPVCRSGHLLPADFAARNRAHLHDGISVRVRTHGRAAPRPVPRQGSLALPALHVRPDVLRHPDPGLARLAPGQGRHAARRPRCARQRERGSAGAIREVDPRLRRLRRDAGGQRSQDSPAGPDLCGAVRPDHVDLRVRRHHGAPAALVLQPAGRLLFHGVVSGRAHAAGAHHAVRREPAAHW